VKKVLVDINVIRDVFLDRQPHVKASTALWAAIEGGQAEGFLSAHALTTIHYLVGRERSTTAAKRTIAGLLSVFSVAAVDRVVLQEALDLPCTVFEDAVSAAAAHAAGCELIVTRDPKGFRGSMVSVLSPEAALPLIVGKRGVRSVV
jgi:predicted nucleic acid-binding protein